MGGETPNGKTCHWNGVGGKWGGSAVGTMAFGALSGGAGAALTGGNFWQGAVTGLIVSGFNHVAHKIQERSMLDKAITKAGFDPDDVARWTDEELTTNIAKIFPDLYESANCPRFEIQDVIGGKDNIYGQAQKTITGSQGNYKVVSKGLIYIKKLALNSVRHVASVAGHELNHVADYVSGNYAGWLNKYNNNAHSEVKAYGWEQSMGSPYFNSQMYNHFLSLTK
jgi:hypothetical protein